MSGSSQAPALLLDDEILTRVVGHPGTPIYFAELIVRINVEHMEGAVHISR